ncbi:hypothetical protein [Xenorhabdus hominickii]|uniref:Uncharacterized protein n=1 Tax=Xenorhabdus hominickii TaxID=351679 RepID=A0A2G0Q3C1_XENHO|nr:hypothetical protein [Xenorhabdus hominickii]AOM39911.1 hypothetical protein A9255_04570 [Xenorhabdus hominickii]PHM53699.1 hypothetical protein Xhom_03700 [Xenorhabdus hominickii]
MKDEKFAQNIIALSIKNAGYNSIFDICRHSHVSFSRSLQGVSALTSLMVYKEARNRSEILKLIVGNSNDKSTHNENSVMSDEVISIDSLFTDSSQHLLEIASGKAFPSMDINARESFSEYRIQIIFYHLM